MDIEESLSLETHSKILQMKGHKIWDLLQNNTVATRRHKEVGG